MKFSGCLCKCLSVLVSVSRVVYHVLFLVYRLFGKNLIIFVAAFILDVGREIFGRRCTKLMLFHIQLFG